MPWRGSLRLDLPGLRAGGIILLRLPTGGPGEGGGLDPEGGMPASLSTWIPRNVLTEMRYQTTWK